MNRIFWENDTETRTIETVTEIEAHKNRPQEALGFRIEALMLHPDQSVLKEWCTCHESRAVLFYFIRPPFPQLDNPCYCHLVNKIQKSADCADVWQRDLRTWHLCWVWLGTHFARHMSLLKIYFCTVCGVAALAKGRNTILNYNAGFGNADIKMQNQC